MATDVVNCLAIAEAFDPVADDPDSAVTRMRPAGGSKCTEADIEPWRQLALLARSRTGVDDLGGGNALQVDVQV